MYLNLRMLWYLDWKTRQKKKICFYGAIVLSLIISWFLHCIYTWKISAGIRKIHLIQTLFFLPSGRYFSNFKQKLKCDNVFRKQDSLSYVILLRVNVSWLKNVWMFYWKTRQNTEEELCFLHLWCIIYLAEFVLPMWMMPQIIQFVAERCDNALLELIMDTKSFKTSAKHQNHPQNHTFVWANTIYILIKIKLMWSAF